MTKGQTYLFNAADGPITVSVQVTGDVTRVYVRGLTEPFIVLPNGGFDIQFNIDTDRQIPIKMTTERLK